MQVHHRLRSGAGGPGARTGPALAAEPLRECAGRASGPCGTRDERSRRGGHRNDWPARASPRPRPAMPSERDADAIRSCREVLAARGPPSRREGGGPARRPSWRCNSNFGGASPRAARTWLLLHLQPSAGGSAAPRYGTRKQRPRCPCRFGSQTSGTLDEVPGEAKHGGRRDDETHPWELLRGRSEEPGGGGHGRDEESVNRRPRSSGRQSQAAAATAKSGYTCTPSVARGLPSSRARARSRASSAISSWSSLGSTGDPLQPQSRAHQGLEDLRAIGPAERFCSS